MDEPAFIEQTINEAASWCAARLEDGSAAMAVAWRTPELEPVDFGQHEAIRGIVAEFESAYGHLPAGARGEAWRGVYEAKLMPRIVAGRREVVRHLGLNRSRLLQSSGSALIRASRSLPAGRLLICTGDSESVTDGASELVSQGFFDVWDLPPWDTWIAYISEPGASRSFRYLLSWVPASAFDLVDEGIHFNPVDCIHWAADFDTPLTQRLRLCDLLT